jgi:hypothetical protein
LAHHPFPSMMLATWWGPGAGSAVAGSDAVDIRQS